MTDDFFETLLNEISPTPSFGAFAEPARTGLKASVHDLAANRIFIGTSSWKYPGWIGQIYDRERYVFRKKFSQARFEKNCLSEYSETFKTVCVDAAYYTFPSEKYLMGLSEQVPVDFRFGLKVTDTITLKHFPNLPRFGMKAGQENPDFLNADRFLAEFLRPCERIREKIGVIILEFSRFRTSDFAHGREFIQMLSEFLQKLPQGWPLAIELRNRTWLQDEYFSCLKSHGVSHAFNSWEAMPPVDEQLQIPGAVTNPRRIAARFLLRPGRPYEKAVELFQPYNAVKEVNENARLAGGRLMRIARESQGEAYIYVNNRLEGNALSTIKAMIENAEFGN